MTEPGFRTLVVEELSPGILQVRLNRPDRLNAIDDVMRDELTGLLRTLPARIESGSVRVLIVTGTGRAFCAGGDVKEFPKIFGGPRPEVERQMLAFQEVPKLVVGLEVPVIAAVNGLAVGGGFVLACACDLRIVAETSRFSLNFVARGLGLDLGGSYFIARLVGLGRALHLASPARRSTRGGRRRSGSSSGWFQAQSSRPGRWSWRRSSRHTRRSHSRPSRARSTAARGTSARRWTVRQASRPRPWPPWRARPDRSGDQARGLPAPSRSQVAGVRACSRSRYFSTRCVGVFGSDSRYSR